MSEIDRFAATVRRLSKISGEDGISDAIALLREEYIAAFPDLPENLKHDFLLYFSGEYARDETLPEILNLSEKLLEAVYLFEGEYDRIVETFTRSDWEYIRDAVADFALELDQETLTYIMRLIVSRGLIKGDNNV